MSDPLDYAAGHTSSGIAGGLGLQIVGISVDNHGAAEDGIRAVEGDLRIHVIQSGDALGVRLQVAQIADMTLIAGRRGVRVIGGIEMTAGRGEIGSGEITVFVHVEAVRPRSEVANFGPDADAALNLIELNPPGNLLALGRLELSDGGRLVGARRTAGLLAAPGSSKGDNCDNHADRKETMGFHGSR